MQYMNEKSCEFEIQIANTSFVDSLLNSKTFLKLKKIFTKKVLLVLLFSFQTSVTRQRLAATLWFSFVFSKI